MRCNSPSGLGTCVKVAALAVPMESKLWSEEDWDGNRV